MDDRVSDYKNEIDYIQSVIGKYFPTYKTEVEYDVVSVFVRVYRGEDIEDRFDGLRKEMVPKNYIPYLREKNGEYVISVKKKPEKSYRGVKTNVVMLFVTIATTLIAGAFWWSSYDPQGGFFSLHNLFNGGLYFALPLMTILGIHELGHYFTAMRHNINASLPFFIPAPPPLGTIGAFISMRDPIPDKKSLLDVGVAGPIAGLLVAIPVSIIGLYLGDVMPSTAPISPEGTLWNFRFPMILRALSFLLPFGESNSFHPTLFAGWVGFLVTGLNLLPAGQLDGGHVVRALLGEKSKFASYAAVAFLIVVGLWQYLGWLIFALFILFLVGLKHPPPLNDFSKLDGKRKVVGVIAVIILFVSFHPVPIEQGTYKYDYNVDLHQSPVQNITIDETAVYTFTLTNVGESQGDIYNISDQYIIRYTNSNSTWSVRMFIQEGQNLSTYEWNEIGQNYTTDTMNKDENKTFKIEVTPVDQNVTNTDIQIDIESNKTDLKKTKILSINMNYEFDTEITGEDMLIENIFLMRRGRDSYTFTVNISNTGRRDSYLITTKEITNLSWGVEYSDDGGQNSEVIVEVLPGQSKDVNMILHTISSRTSDTKFYTEDYYSENTRAGENVIVRFTVQVESLGSDKLQEFTLVGVQP